MKLILPLLLAATTIVSHGVAHAGPMEVSNTTVVTGSDGQSYTSVGANFHTLGLAVSGADRGGSYALTLAYTTTFNGIATSGDVSTYYPDIFLRVPGMGTNTQSYNLAVALGDEAANAGRPAGLYTPGSVATSQSIWSGRSGYIFGAGYQSSPGASSVQAPVVMLSGSQVGGTHVVSKMADTNTQAGGLELYKLTVTISGLSASLADMFANGFDAFWGTGDCANGAFLASVTQNPFFQTVPEPASVPLAVTGFVTLGLLRRRRGRA